MVRAEVARSRALTSEGFPSRVSLARDLRRAGGPVCAKRLRLAVTETNPREKEYPLLNSMRGTLLAGNTGSYQDHRAGVRSSIFNRINRSAGCPTPYRLKIEDLTPSRLAQTGRPGARSTRATPETESPPPKATPEPTQQRPAALDPAQNLTQLSG